jgi:hypothetical protein
MSGCSPQNIERWSRKWYWVSRAQSFDAVEEEKMREQLCRERTTMRLRQIKVGQAMMAVGIAGLREWQQRIQQKLPLNLSPEQVSQLVKVGSELERVGHGEEAQSRFTRIQVIVEQSPDEDLPEDVAAARLEAGDPALPMEEVNNYGERWNAR